jgi:hypothetical protein
MFTLTARASFGKIRTTNEAKIMKCRRYFLDINLI